MERKSFTPTSPTRPTCPTRPTDNRIVRVLGIDYGARRIGLALSDATATLASPWRMIERPGSEPETLDLLIREITALVERR